MKKLTKIVCLFIITIIYSCSSDNNSTKEFLCCMDNPFADANVDNLNDEQNPVTISKIITPNGDGVYDIFSVRNINFYPDNEVTIYDQNGNVVFQKNGYTNTSENREDNFKNIFFGNNYKSNKELPSGTYKYKLVIENENTFVENGYICLIRNSDEVIGLDINACNLPLTDPTL